MVRTIDSSPDDFFGVTAMLDFEKYVARHGEFGVQAIVETIERNEGIRDAAVLSLEERWNVLMQKTASERCDLAA
jgi:hypothetical protein